MGPEAPGAAQAFGMKVEVAAGRDRLEFGWRPAGGLAAASSCAAAPGR